MLSVIAVDIRNESRVEKISGIFRPSATKSGRPYVVIGDPPSTLGPTPDPPDRGIPCTLALHCHVMVWYDHLMGAGRLADEAYLLACAAAESAVDLVVVFISLQHTGHWILSMFAMKYWGWVFVWFLKPWKLLSWHQLGWVLGQQRGCQDSIHLKPLHHRYSGWASILDSFLQGKRKDLTWRYSPK